MKLLRYIVLVLMLANFGGNKANAQIDTLFWFAAPWVTPDHDGNTPLAFRISTFGNAATVRIQLPAWTYDTTFLVPANSLADVPLTHIVNNLESMPADAILTTGIKITSDELITAVYDFISQSPNNPETYSLKGQNGMGTEFVVPFQTLWDNRLLGGASPVQPKQYFSVVATEDNTTIYITPNCDVIGHPADITYPVVLPLAGNVYTCENLVQTTSVPGSSLSGSIVVSNKPISVVINDDSVNPAGGGGCFDLMGDQIVPTDVIGTDYNVNIGFLNPGSNESIFIIATENFTTITVDDGAATTQLANQGSTWQYSLTAPLTSIVADKPVYVIHMSGYGCELGLAILPPLNCAGSDEVSFARNNGQSFLLNLLCANGDEGGFALTGPGTGTITAAAFAVVPGTGGAWVGAQIAYTTAEIPVGTQNTITNSSGFFSMGVINGGASTGCLYHYMSSFNRKVLTNAGLDTTLCNGVPVVDLIGSVSGGTTTGIWTVLDGTGTLNNPTTLTTTYDPSPGDYTQGYLTFVLASTGNCEPVTDTMRVTYIQSPITDAGLDDIYCKNNISTIPINGSVQFATGSLWTGGNGGAFANAGLLSTTYTPSPADLAADSVVLYLTSAGSLFACADDEDTLVIYFTEPPAVIAGVDVTICSSASVINLSGSVTGASTTGIWSSTGSGGYLPGSGSLITDYQITAGDTAAGSLVLTLESTLNGSCLAEKDSILVTFLDEPNVVITSSDTICSNLSLLDLDGLLTSGYTSIWTTTGFGSVVAPGALNTQYNITVPDVTAGFIDVFLTSNGGICPSIQDSMRVYFIDPPIADAGPPQSFCSNEVIQLNGTITGVAATGSWSTMGTGTFSPGANFLITNYIPSALDVTNGSVNLILTTSSVFGCAPVVDIVTITFKAAPDGDFSFTTNCEGTNTAFTDLSTTTDGTIATWDWEFGDAGISIAQNPLHAYAGSGTYNAQLIVGGSNGCFDTITYPIGVNPNPIADFDPTVACANTPIYFNDLSFISSGSVVGWLYDFGGPTSTLQDPIYSYPNSGSYPVTLTVTSDLGCVDDTTISVSVSAAPVANFSFAPSLAFVLENVTFTDQSTGFGINNWLWDFGDNNGSNVQDPIHGYADGGDYEIFLIVTDANGCEDTVSKFITIALPPALPTGFTPNGDGENDVFIIRGGPFKTVDFKVYNQWGELIYNSNDAAEGWDGTYQGEPALLGVYTWTYVIELANNKVLRESGDVTLMR